MATPTRTRSKAKALSKEADIQRKRQNNFSKEEDLFICRAFVNISQDPIKGNDRKATTFWTAVQDKFNELYKEESEDYDETLDRTADALMHRFKRTIHKEMQDFNKAYKAVSDENKSGYTPQDIVDAALEQYKEEHGKAFRFQHCVETLRKMPKYCVAKSNKKDSDKANVSVYSSAGDNLERPIGSKAAKKREREKKADDKKAEKKIGSYKN